MAEKPKLGVVGPTNGNPADLTTERVGKDLYLLV